MKQLLFLLSSVALAAVSCTTNKQLTTAKTNGGEAIVPDYSDLRFWAAHPNKKDLSDSIPKPFRNNYQALPIAVFFVHPTTFSDKNNTAFNASLADEALNQQTEKTSIFYQASAFNEGAVYAPFYRQGHLSNFYRNDTANARKAFDLAYEDVAAAFAAFLQQKPANQPFIIAAHSQGTKHCARLIAEKIEGSPYQSQMIAAYLIGLPVDAKKFRETKACTTPNSTGCIVSWRTFRNGTTPDYIEKEPTSIIVTNPLTWDINQPNADKQQHQGAILYKFNTLFPEVNNAVVHGNVLWISKPKFPGGLFLRRTNYHIGDINLFWANIRSNVRERASAYINGR